jgi:hypothetical protein
MDVGLRHGSCVENGKKLAFRELRCLTGFLESVLATFLGSRVAAEMTLSFKGFAVIWRKVAKSTCRTLLDGISLSGQATATDIYKEVILGLEPKGLKGGLNRSQIDGVVI